MLACHLVGAQVLLNPCTSLPGCQSSVRNGVVHSKLTLLTANQKYNLLVGAGDTLNNQIDTTFSGSVDLKLVSGPGTFVGAANKSFSKYTYMDMKFFNAGDYELEIDIPGVGKDTIFFAVSVDDFTEMCVNNPQGCVSGGGTKIKMQGPNVIVVDVMFPFNVMVVNAQGKIDITYAGVVTLSKLSGAGNFNGNLSLYGEQRISFNDLSFDQIGNYEVVVDVEHVGVDTVTLVVIAGNSVKYLEDRNCLVYPNPSTGRTSVLFGDSPQYVGAINVLDVLGETVKSFELNRTVDAKQIVDLDLSDLLQGTYFIDIKCQQFNIYSSVVLLK